MNLVLKIPALTFYFKIFFVSKCLAILDSNLLTTIAKQLVCCGLWYAEITSLLVMANVFSSTSTKFTTSLL